MIIRAVASKRQDEWSWLYIPMSKKKILIHELFHFYHKIMISPKEEIFYIRNCTVKVKSEFPVLHVRHMGEDLCFLCGLNVFSRWLNWQRRSQDFYRDTHNFPNPPSLPPQIWNPCARLTFSLGTGHYLLGEEGHYIWGEGHYFFSAS